MDKSLTNKPYMTGVSLTDHERVIVERESSQRGLNNFSAAMRLIIREWDEMKRQASPQPTQDAQR